MTDINKEYEKEYYDEYRNNYYNPDDDDGEPGINLNWKRIQKGFHSVAAGDQETAETISGMQAVLGTLSEDVDILKTDYTAMSNEVTDLKSALIALDNQVNGGSASPTVITVTGLNIAAAGSVYESSSNRNTQYFPVSSGSSYQISVTSGDAKLSRLAFSLNVPASGVSATYIEQKTGSYNYSYSASTSGYFSISYYGSDVTNITVSVTGNTGIATKIENIEDSISILEPVAADSDVGKTLIVKSVFNGKVTEYEFGKSVGDDDYVSKDEFVTGYINSSGSYSSGGSNSNYVTLAIDASRFESISISCDDDYQFYVAYYNGTTFVSRSDYYNALSGIITVENTYNVRIGVATIETGTSETLDTVYPHVHIGLNNKNVSTLFRILHDGGFYGLPFVQKIISSDTGGKVIHYSVDDVWSCLKDITVQQYTSVFENTFFANLKNVHDSNGCCFTLNCFNTVSTDATYSISNLPNRYQTELQSCKSWLRFAFHAEDDETNYNTASGILDSYSTFVNAIYNLTGDYECIDTITRLGFFGGNLTNVLAIKGTNHGIMGLLCADNISRKSYYLDPKQNEMVQTKGKYIDPVNELIFCRSTTRMLSNAVAELEGNLCYQKYVEIFWHEQDGFPTSNLGNIATWALQKGYSNAFPCDIFK